MTIERRAPSPTGRAESHPDAATPAMPPLPLDRLPAAADPDQAARGRERWLAAAAALDADDPETAGFARSLVGRTDGRALLDAVFGNSPFLGQCLLRELGCLRTLVEHGVSPAVEAVLAMLAPAATAGLDTAPLMTRLRVARRRAMLVIGLADITGAWPIRAVARGLSDFADAAVGAAARHALRAAARAGQLALPDPDDPEQGSGLVVLGMGKLGARELNYSSDVDLILLYDDATAPVPRPDQMARTFIRLARELVRLLDEHTADGRVARVDLRLRPDPGATPIAVSITAAETYYASVGQNWERAAMIRARAIAGDTVAAQALMHYLKPFIWRRHLDFAAIQDIHSIKRQINAHRGHTALKVDGHDIKVGRGGIREVEFFAQTQQLIFGGRDVRLRTVATTETLRALAETGRISIDAASELVDAYWFLRRVEHRIQMVDDRQTHRLPADDAGVAAIATFLGYPDAAGFRDALLCHLTRVEGHYALLFEEAPSLSGPGNLVFTGTDYDPGTVDTLARLGFANPTAVIDTVSTWHRGRYRAMRSARARELLTELTPALLHAFGRTPQPDAALRNFDASLGGLPAGVQLFSLFYANPWLLDLVAEIMGTAPPLAAVLARHSELFDAVLGRDFFGALPDLDTLEAGLARGLADARDFEDTLLMCRRWANEQRFRAGVHILRAITDADRCGRFLSDIATVALAAMLRAVEDGLAERHGRFPGANLAILAMGKLGGRQLTIGSDLDLIVVYETPPDQPMSDGARPLAPTEYHIRLTKRLVTALTAQSAEGKLYDVDMRLRPSGTAGPLAVSFESFRRYHREAAWTWEHMALTRARPMLGPAAFRDRLATAIREVLTAPRDPAKLIRDVADMRRRIDAEFGTDNPWEVKYVRGGVMDINFIVQTLLLRHAHGRPELLATNTADGLANLRTAGLIDDADAAVVAEGLSLWRRILGFLRLTVEGGVLDPAEVPAGLRPGLARIVLPETTRDDPAAIDFAAVEAKVRSVQAAVHRLFRTLIEDPAAPLPAPTPEETPAP